MALYVKNPNYNPNDPRSPRYVTNEQAVQQAGTRATTMNDLFAPFTALASGLKPYVPEDYYKPITPNARVTSPTPAGQSRLPTGTTVNFTSANQSQLPAQQVQQTQQAGANAAIPATGAPAPTTSSVYTVQAGDTLGAIAARNGTTVAELARINGIADPNRISAGQQIQLGGTAAPTAGAGAPAGGAATPDTVAAAIASTAQAKGGRLTPDEISTLAKQAGEAGLSTDAFLSILQANSQVTGAEVDDIRTKLGIPNLVDEAFRKPEKSTIDRYRELYDLAGLRNVQTKISELDERINQKRGDLVKATGELNNNPWISQGTRAGRLRSLQELAYADINNDIALRNSYLETYDTGVDEIERQLGFITADEEADRGLTVEKLNYLLNEAERQQTALGQDTITAGLRTIPDFLQGVLNREQTEASRALALEGAKKGGTGGFNIADIVASGGGAEAIVQASAGGKATTDTFRTSYEKTLNTLAQLSDLSKAFEVYKENTGQTGFFSGAESEITGPIIGVIRSANPFDTKAQQIKAQLTALVPNLARGVYGEVGVLTDQDIALYQQTLPNLKSTKEVRDALLAITAKSVYRALENKLLVQAKGGVDVSGFTTDLTTMRNLTDSLLQSAGINTEESVPAGAGYTNADVSYVQSLGLQ